MSNTDQEPKSPQEGAAAQAPKLQIDLSKYKKASSNQQPEGGQAPGAKTVTLENFEKGSLQEKYAKQKQQKEAAAQ